jgi:hypothetical protein
MKIPGMLALMGVLFLCSLSAQEIRLDSKTSASFATIEQARVVLGAKDEFVERMSPFDRAARMKTDRIESEAEYLMFASNNALAWTVAETAKVANVMEKLGSKLTAFQPNLPESILLIKTTGREEGGAAYTRGNAVILPRIDIASEEAELSRLLAHEIFHIITRLNPEMRKRLYASIGFLPCGEIGFPEDLKSRKITNPDAPKNDYYIQVTSRGQKVSVVPILYANKPTYDLASGGEFFDYLVLKMLAIENKADAWQAKLVNGKPVLIGMEEIQDLFSQVGRNTEYVLHPEEILADNFALLVLGNRDVPSPDVLKKLEQILAKDGKSKP